MTAKFVNIHDESKLATSLRERLAVLPLMDREYRYSIYAHGSLEADLGFDIVDIVEGDIDHAMHEDRVPQPVKVLVRGDWHDAILVLREAFLEESDQRRFWGLITYEDEVDTAAVERGAHWNLFDGRERYVPYYSLPFNNAAEFLTHVGRLMVLLCSQRKKELPQIISSLEFMLKQNYQHEENEQDYQDLVNTIIKLLRAETFMS